MTRVYFIKPIGMDGPIKIGCSASPTNRLCSLSTWSPFPLEIIAQVDGDYQLERRFHALFLHLHERREWFKAAPEITAVVERINAGEFDITTLPAGIRVDRKHIVRPPHFGPQLSYSLRVSHAQSRSGMRCPVNPRGMVKANDLERIAIVDAFLADPDRHGIPNPWRRRA